MSSGIISKYLIKKKKDLLDYAKTLETIISIDDNNLWKTKAGFEEYASKIISYYVDRYYFENNIHRDNPVEYSNDNINYVLKSMLEYFKDIKQSEIVKTKKNEVFLLSVIICSASYADIACNVVDGNYSDTKEKFKFLLKYLEKTEVLKIYINNQRTVEVLFKKIRDNRSKEEKFFKSFISDDLYNEYSLYTKEEDYYLVNYNYQVKDLDYYDIELTKRVEEKYIDKYCLVSYELVAVKLLQEYISNGSVHTYLIKASEGILKKDNSFDIFDDTLLKEKVKIIIPYENQKQYKEYTDKLKEEGYSVIYDFCINSEVSANTFVRNLDVLVSEEFKKNNEEKIYSWNSQGINFVLKNKEEEL